MVAITSTLHIKCPYNYKFAFIVLVSKSTVFFCLFVFLYTNLLLPQTPSDLKGEAHTTESGLRVQHSIFFSLHNRIPRWEHCEPYRCKTRRSCCSYDLSDLSVLNQFRQGEADGMDSGLSDGQGFPLPSNYPLWLIWFLTEKFPNRFFFVVLVK